MPHALDLITNIVVLMLENGSFDRMLGFLQREDYAIAGLTGTETVPLYPTDPNSPQVRVTTGVPYRGSFDVIPNDPPHLPLQHQVFQQLVPVTGPL